MCTENILYIVDSTLYVCPGVWVRGHLLFKYVAKGDEKMGIMAIPIRYIQLVLHKPRSKRQRNSRRLLLHYRNFSYQH